MSIAFRPARARHGHLRSWWPTQALSVSAAAFALLLAAVLGIGWIASERAIHPAICHYDQGLADFPDLHPYQVNIESRTHTRIASWFFPGTRRATVLLSHGYGDNQIQMLPYADFLVRQGFSVLTYDMRNRGRSSGDAVTLGALEGPDILSAVDYLMTRPDVDPNRIGAMGLSLGAAATILAAAGEPQHPPRP